MKTNRKIGIEMEGYIDFYPKGLEILGVRIKQDGSLENWEWEDEDEPYGVELVTHPMTDLSDLHRTWEDMKRYGWGVDGEAGTHVHIDISDFSTLEKVKLIAFAKAIEDIVFMFTENYRTNNEYCEEIHPSWKHILTNDKYKDIDWNSLHREDVNEYLENKFGFRYLKDSTTPWNGKYQWLNVLDSKFHTVEFRLFHAVRSMDEVIKQARMAEAIVDLAKASSLEQLEFIVAEILSQMSIDDVANKFFEALSLDFTLPIINRNYKYRITKLVEINNGIKVPS